MSRGILPTLHSNGSVPNMRDELIEQGVPRTSANRLAFRSSFYAALEVTTDRWGKIWLCFVIFLVLGMFGVLIWSQRIYEYHQDDTCDQALAPMLRVLYIIIGLHAFQREIIRHILCYSMVRDGPQEPCRVVIFRRLTLSATFVWPIVGIYMLANAHNCTPELKNAIKVIIAYYAVVLFVAVLLPTLAVTTMMVLLRHGFVRMPRSRNAAPANLIDELPKVEFEPRLFDDSGAPGSFPSQCSICLESFNAERQISKTNCQPNGHAFHTDCLAGWLQLARTCPLCRVDLTEEEQQPPDIEAGMSFAARPGD